MYGKIEYRRKDGSVIHPDRGPVMDDGSYLQSYTMHDLMEAVHEPSDWGPWSLREDNLTILCSHYYVDLERCFTSGQILDWIMQIAKKSWADDAHLSGLARAINDCVNPQSVICSMGGEGRLSESQLRKRVRSAMRIRSEGFRVYPELDAIRASTEENGRYHDDGQ